MNYLFRNQNNFILHLLARLKMHFYVKTNQTRVYHSIIMAYVRCSSELVLLNFLKDFSLYFRVSFLIQIVHKLMFPNLNFQLIFHQGTLVNEDFSYG